MLFALTFTNSILAETWVLVAEWNENTLGKDTLFQRYIDTDSITQMDNIISSRFYVSSTYAGGGHVATISVDCNRGFFTFNTPMKMSYQRKSNFFGKVTWQPVRISNGEIVQRYNFSPSVNEGRESAYSFLCNND